MKDRVKLPSRRKLLRTGVAATIAFGALAWRGRQEARALPIDALRPPGALPEHEFTARCVRCGLCVDACPYDTLKTADLGAAVPVGTPYFVARDTPCEMCADMPCVRICPTGALSAELARIEDARMGTARLAHEERCYSFIGAAFCQACYRACPLGDTAIRMQPGHTRRGGRFTPAVDARVCTGCGRCEQACAAADAAIIVAARR